MALISCPQCTNLISDFSQTCGYCDTDVVQTADINHDIISFEEVSAVPELKEKAPVVPTSNKLHKKGYRKLTAHCPECRHEFGVDAGYLGILRTCPECAHKFMFDSPVESDVLVNKIKRDHGRVSCSTCYRMFTSTSVYAELDDLSCGICGAHFSRKEGEALHNKIQQAEKMAMRNLLNGIPHVEVRQKMTALSLPQKGVTIIFHRLLNELPFRRSENVEGKDAAETPTITCCDLCGRSLIRYEQARLYAITWNISQNTGERQLSPLSVGSIFAGVLITEQRAERSYRYGLYGLCTGCVESAELTYPIGYELERRLEIVLW
ncbi:hypothetical protein BVY04_02765 [bacterium M21]|nr:hypothetical protein BVY04_02765 [bacterium M21]